MAVKRIAEAVNIPASTAALAPTPPAHAASTSKCDSAPSHSACDGVIPGGPCTTGTNEAKTSAPMWAFPGRGTNTRI
jgi:hypothetical protein